MYLYFTSQESAMDALLTINYNMGVPINWDEINNLPIDEKHYFCSTWNNLRKAKDIDVWFFLRPEENFMTGVENYQEIEAIPAEWLEISVDI